ncbi:DNA replication protein psf2 [Trichoglossum hirsutum]|uniref:DNA replication complex GINS protein PSF2 n=1 Tax=Trichoglossum hirsutum TaxID=265104 RepID=A0A9P8LEF9_9PEZI|nr:DNA replication protein psf2 [Trichoglossum hirsutum]
MALPSPPGLTPLEIAFLCEMEMVTVVPRQRLEGLELLGGPTKPLHPPHRTSLPLWLALLLKRQRRANILPPPWFHPTALTSILDFERSNTDQFTPPPPLPPSPPGTATTSPPFLSSSTADAPDGALPYHWLELGEILLDAAPDDIVDPDAVRRLMRDLREVRMAKMRAGVAVLDGSGMVGLKGVGGMEVSEGRAFISGVVDGLRKIGASREQALREREAEEGDDAYEDIAENAGEMDL